MTEFQLLYSHLKEKHSFSDEDAQLFVNHFNKRNIKKSQFVIQPDFIAKYRIYVIKGAFRAYVIGNDGQEHTISLAIEDWWITDPNSYIYQQPATMFIEAMEDSVILQLDFAKEEALKKVNPKFESFFTAAAERGLAYMQRRIIASLTLTAEERFDEFTKNYPGLLQRMPQYTIASFLGMTTEYLSRIRNKKVKY